MLNIMPGGPAFLNQNKMSKKKLREWEIPMNLSDKEKKEYGMTTTHKINNTAKRKQDDKAPEN